MLDEETTWVWALCQPCWDARHDLCQGAAVWCECMTEAMFEVEETP